MHTTRCTTTLPAFAILGLSATLLAITACQESGAAEAPVVTVVTDDAPERQYGPALPIGRGEVRTYVVVDPATNAPMEVGVALSESALDGLPDLGSGHKPEHESELFHTFNLELPTGHGTPFRFVEMNWNPFGHEPEGVYLNVPHFDFHFYTISVAERDAIMPEDPEWAAKADRLPAANYLPAHNVILSPPDMTPAQVAVPMMGVHWVDTRSPELQAMFGSPEGYRPFTTTFIHGTWNGDLIFWEPMVTREHILSKKAATDPAVREETLALPLPSAYQRPGYYPDAYGIAWDPEAREYRIALKGFAQRN